ncbi:8-amino-7-oxononanoate synthase [Kiritimatiella glycovorans]|nr:8-amino-7-oxononanoate synthase [Kiritimatiella glycovorans]
MDWIESGLERLRTGGRLRRTRVFPAAGGKLELDGRETLNFSSNDYLDLARNPRVIAAAREALEQYGAGATASRLVCGTLPPHETLEHRIAAWKGREAALVFGSGYAANAGILPRLAGRGDVVLADRLAHASLLDAAVLSRARLIRFRHNDPQDLERRLKSLPGKTRRILVVTESVFSMDGDLAPLEELAGLAHAHGAMLLVDEAHASGVFGERGRGRLADQNGADAVTVDMGTLSKALASCGGFAACDAKLREWLVNGSRSFIYSTAPPPAAMGAALGALDVVEADPAPGPELLRRADLFRAALRAQGVAVKDSESQIVPVIVGEDRAAVGLSAALEKKAILVPAIRPPTVPEGTARLRFSLTLAHQEDDLRRAAAVLGETMRQDSNPDRERGRTVMPSDSARRILLLSGWGYPAAELDPLAKALRDTGHEVVLSGPEDLWGRGGGGKSEQPFVDGLESLIAEQGPFERHAGWSLGAMLLLERAVREDGPAGGLVLCGVTPRFCSGRGWPCGVASAEVRTMQRMLRSDPEPVLREFYRRSAAPRAAEGAEVRIEKVLSAGVEVLSAGLRFLQSFDILPLLAGVRGRVHLLHGSCDGIVPVAAARRLEAELPAARLEEMQGEGHALPLYCVDELSRRIAL